MIFKSPTKNPRRIKHTFIHVADIYPTLADFAGVENFDDADLLGDSAKPLIEGRSDEIGDDEFGLEYFGERAYRSGEWKLVFAAPAFGGTGDWALYNLKEDPGETHDISEKYPEIMSELAIKWHRYADKNGIVVSPMVLVNNLAERIKSLRLSTDWAVQ